MNSVEASPPDRFSDVWAFSAEFETDDQVRQEDAERAKRILLALPYEGPLTWLNMGPRLRYLRQCLRHLQRPSIDGSAALDLKAKLELGTSTSLASSVAMRCIRQTVLGALQNALADYSDAELRTVTVINRGWAFTADALDRVTAATIKNRFRTHLNKIGLTQVPGPFIAFLHGEFEPTSGTYQLHFHIVTTAAKAPILKRLTGRWGYEKTPTGAPPVVSRRVCNRAKQLSYLLKSYWPQRAVRLRDGVPKRDRRGSRISEPFGTQVLLWLDRQRLRNLTLMPDCWSLRNGGSDAMRTLYLSIFGPW
jgi:hypothetical protein